MHDTALVVSIEKDEITVIPLIKNACLSCKEGCAKRGNPFQVVNPLQLPVKINSIVKIGTTKQKELKQTLSSIVFPSICALAAYFLSLFIEKNAGKIFASDGMHALFTLLGFVSGAALIYLIARNKKNLEQPEITEVCS